MLGISLTLFSLCLFFSKRYRYLSYFIYISLMLDGLKLWTNPILGIKAEDCALVYTAIISLYLLHSRRWRIPQGKEFRYYKFFICFLLFSAAFSFVHYGLNLFQIIQGGRRFFLFLSLPILIRIKPRELQKIFRLLLYVVFITSILYIGQSITGKALMPYEWATQETTTAGLHRFYNIPLNLALFLSLSFLYPQFFKPFKLHINYFRAVFIIALICTLGRTFIFTTFTTILLSLLLAGKAKSTLKAAIASCVVLFLFSGILSDRYEEGNTAGDLALILQGAYKDYQPEDLDGPASMLFRFAWVYERGAYLIQRPLGEQFFGMGLCSDSQDWVNKKYHFKVGLVDKERGKAVQLSTADISYGLMLTYLGFGGMIIYIMMLIGILNFFWKRKTYNPLFSYNCAFIIMSLVEGFSSSTLASIQVFVMLFATMSIWYSGGTPSGLLKIDKNNL